jgi:hypothetical protein
MENGNKPINAVLLRQVGDKEFRVASEKDSREGMFLSSELGLTKREYFALMLTEKNSVSYRPLSLYQWFRWALGLSYKGCTRPFNEMAERGVELADELLKQLENNG